MVSDIKKMLTSVTLTRALSAVLQQIVLICSRVPNEASKALPALVSLLFPLTDKLHQRK
jgi:hypothetical protein